MMRLHTTAVCLTLLASPLSAQQPGLAGYDLAELDAIAIRRQVDVRAMIARAAARDPAALRVIMVFADDPDSASLRTSRGFAALLWSLLNIWGDRAFAAELDLILADRQRLILDVLDRGAGVVYGGAFPRTWSMGPHDSTLLGLLHLDRPAAIDVGTCTARGYPPQLLDHGIAGRAVVEMTLDSTGAAAGERRIVTVAATHSAFAVAAETFLRGCRYLPARRGAAASRPRSASRCRSCPTR